MKPITEYTELELKALAYDQRELLEQTANNLKVIKAELDKRKLPQVKASETKVD